MLTLIFAVLVTVLLAANLWLAIDFLISRNSDGKITLASLLLERFTAVLKAQGAQAEVQVIKTRKLRAEALGEAEEAESRLELERVARGDSPELAMAMIRHEIKVEELRHVLHHRRALRENIKPIAALPQPSGEAVIEVEVSDAEIERMALRISQQLSKTSYDEAERQLQILGDDLRSRLPELVVEEVLRRANAFREMSL